MSVRGRYIYVTKTEMGGDVPTEEIFSSATKAAADLFNFFEASNITPVLADGEGNYVEVNESMSLEQIRQHGYVMLTEEHGADSFFSISRVLVR